MSVAAPAGKVRRTTSGTVLEVRDLHVTFPSEAGPVRAVRGLDFTLAAGETMAIVGESGSGKSVTSLAIMGLHPEAAKITGSIKLHGDELLGRSDEAMSRLRGEELAMIFQDPLSALTPVYTIGDQIVETMQVHHSISRADALNRAIELLDLVGIPNPAVRVKSFPHEFSGGMRQRAMIAMAIANDPDVIIADEPTTALDVTIQAQVLEVLKKAQQETGAAVIMITHDLGVVAGIADRVTVMYAGRPVEQGTRGRDLLVAADAVHDRSAGRGAPAGRHRTRRRWPRWRETRPRWSTCRRAAPSRRAARCRTDLCRTDEPPLAPDRSARAPGRLHLLGPDRAGEAATTPTSSRCRRSPPRRSSASPATSARPCSSWTT